MKMDEADADKSQLGLKGEKCDSPERASRSSDLLCGATRNPVAGNF